MIPAPGIVFRSTGGVLDFYILQGESPEDVLQQYHNVGKFNRNTEEDLDRFKLQESEFTVLNISHFSLLANQVFHHTGHLGSIFLDMVMTS